MRVFFPGEIVMPAVVARTQEGDSNARMQMVSLTIGITGVAGKSLDQRVVHAFLGFSEVPRDVRDLADSFFLCVFRYETYFCCCCI